MDNLRKGGTLADRLLFKIKSQRKLQRGLVGEGRVTGQLWGAEEIESEGHGEREGLQSPAMTKEVLPREPPSSMVGLFSCSLFNSNTT